MAISEHQQTPLCRRHKFTWKKKTIELRVHREKKIKAENNGAPNPNNNNL